MLTKTIRNLHSYVQNHHPADTSSVVGPLQQDLFCSLMRFVVYQLALDLSNIEENPHHNTRTSFANVSAALHCYLCHFIHVLEREMNFINLFSPFFLSQQELEIKKCNELIALNNSIRSKSSTALIVRV